MKQAKKQIKRMSVQRIHVILDKILAQKSSTISVRSIAKALLQDEYNHPGAGYDTNFGLELARRVLQDLGEL